MNVELLNRVVEKFRRFPDTLWMNTWAVKTEVSKEAPCGTIGCIAANAAMLTYKIPLENVGSPDIPWPTMGKEALELSNEQADRLFYLRSWPERFARAYHYAVSAAARVEVLADRVQHFIETDGTDLYGSSSNHHSAITHAT